MVESADALPYHEAMKLGLHLADFTYGVEPAGFAAKLDEIVRSAEDAGFDRISVMDHYLQIAPLGPVEREMFEAYGILGYIAARTSRVKIGVLATGVTYRQPGFLVKQVTGLDVLSGGRAWLGIGAAWFEREHLALGFPFPPLGERFERLEEALQICLQMWSDDDGPFEGKHYRLQETICSPRPVQRPRPPILVAGSGERKTLRLVARYGDACNVGGAPEDVRRRFEVLRRHCEAEGTDYDAIERTVMLRLDPGPNGEHADELVDTLGQLAEAGTQAALGWPTGVGEPSVIETLGDRVIPQVASF